MLVSILHLQGDVEHLETLSPSVKAFFTTDEDAGQPSTASKKQYRKNIIRVEALHVLHTVAASD